MKLRTIVLGMVLVGGGAAFALGAFDRGGEAARGGWFNREGGRTVTTSAGDAELGASGLLEFEVTSDLFRRWSLAQQSIGKTEGARAVVALGRRALTQEELDKVITRLEQDARARTAIEGAQLTVREYVYVTVAMEQAMAVASGKLQPRRDAVASAPVQDPAIVSQYGTDVYRGADTLYYPPAPAPPVLPIPAQPPPAVPPPAYPVRPVDTPLPRPLPDTVAAPRPDTAPPTPAPGRPRPEPAPPVPAPAEPAPRPAEPPPGGPPPADPSPSPTPTPPPSPAPAA